MAGKRRAENGDQGKNEPSKSKKEDKHPDSTEVPMDWRDQPPYKPADPDKEFDTTYTGACHCKKVKFLVHGEPLKVKYCHCKGCQRTHGAPFQWSGIYKKTDILFTEGHEYIEDYSTKTGQSDHTLPCKLLCSECHSPLGDEGRNMIMLFPTTLEFENDEIPDTFAPQAHLFYKSRVLDLMDGVPKWAGLDGKSEQIDEADVHKVVHHKGGKGAAETAKARE